MAGVRLPAQAWVVICDGSKALFLRNEGDEKFYNLREFAVVQEENAPTREQGADRPGRVHASQGEARSSVEDEDWHNQKARHFLERLAIRLEKSAATGEYQSLVLIAPPKSMGILREYLTMGVRSKITAEILKDLIKVPIYEIEKRLEKDLL